MPPAGPATTPLPLRSPTRLGFRSLAGGAGCPVGGHPEGCPRGRAAGRPAGLVAAYAACALPRAPRPGGRVVVIGTAAGQRDAAWPAATVPPLEMVPA